MTALTVRNEFAKMRHLRIGVIGLVLVLGVVGLTLVSTASSGDEDVTWAAPLAGTSLAVPMVSPLLIAVIASRALEMEHQGNGWLLNQTAGTSRGALCRAKFLSTGAIVTTATVIAGLVACGVGSLLGITARAPMGLWAGYIGSAVVVNLVVLAWHVAASARLDNQLVPLGVGILGTVIALCATAFPAWLAHATPWGYYALIAAGDYQGDHVVTLTPSYPSVLTLAVVAAALFVVFTRRLDRQEV